MTAAEPLVAGVELGGTKCIAVLARGSTILERRQWPTLAPKATLPPIADALSSWHRREPLAALGIGSFGPIDLAADSSTIGQILATPKRGWSGVNVRSVLSDALDLPVGVETDVTGAAMAEGRWGASIDCDTHAYITVGTGIGVGIVIDGVPVHGALHPEIGHARVRRDCGDGFLGSCPFHGDCLEGLASGPAIAARARMPIESMPSDHPLWSKVAHELAELVNMIYLTIAPSRIVIGGGVVERQPGLLPRIIDRAEELACGYPTAEQAERLRAVIRAPKLGSDAGPLGSVAVALRALSTSESGTGTWVGAA